MAGKLATFVDVDGVWYGPDDNVPADVAKRITNPKAWAEQPSTDQEPATGEGQKAGTGQEVVVEPYKGVTVPELQAEITARNEDRSEGQLIQVDAGAKRPELVAALVADDQK